MHKNTIRQAHYRGIAINSYRKRTVRPLSSVSSLMLSTEYSVHGFSSEQGAFGELGEGQNVFGDNQGKLLGGVLVIYKICQIQK